MAIQPERLSAGLRTLQAADSALSAVEATIAASTTGLPSAGADEVSALMAMQFTLHGESYQAVSAQARAMHEMFVSILAAGAKSRATTNGATAVAEG